MRASACANGYAIARMEARCIRNLEIQANCLEELTKRMEHAEELCSELEKEIYIIVGKRNNK